MALSDQQIERYSRQIIVAGIGGIGQERLLTAHLVIVGDVDGVEPVLAYMVGAGVGRITLQLTGGADADAAALIERMGRLNRDVSVKNASMGSDEAETILALAGSSSGLEAIRALVMRQSRGRLIFARLDSPARIAILPAPPPCVVCADAELFSPFSRRSDYAGFVAMAAAVETFKLIAQPAAIEKAVLLEFNGYAPTAGEIHVRHTVSACRCASPTRTVAR